MPETMPEIANGRGTKKSKYMESMLECVPETPGNAIAEASLSKSNNPGQAGDGYSSANMLNVKV